MSNENLPPPPGSGEPAKPREGWPRWSLWVLIAFAVSLLFLPMLLNSESGDEISYGEFKEQLSEGNVRVVRHRTLAAFLPDVTSPRRRARLCAPWSSTSPLRWNAASAEARPRPSSASIPASPECP